MIIIAGMHGDIVAALFCIVIISVSSLAMTLSFLFIYLLGSSALIRLEKKHVQLQKKVTAGTLHGMDCLERF